MSDYSATSESKRVVRQTEENFCALIICILISLRRTGAAYFERHREQNNTGLKNHVLNFLHTFTLKVRMSAIIRQNAADSRNLIS
jgi:hypothetical protein